jgi:hypothetical protein
MMPNKNSSTERFAAPVLPGRIDSIPKRVGKLMTIRRLARHQRPKIPSIGRRWRGDKRHTHEDQERS